MMPQDQDQALADIDKEMVFFQAQENDEELRRIIKKIVKC